MENNSIVFTNDNCIGCNKCIKVCSAIGACISKEEHGKARIEVDGSKCVACGSCIDVCVHGAREFEDDTERFFHDLKNGKRISLLVAPAFKANYPDKYESVLGSLKAMGVNRIISVSFGADICTWGYLNYIDKYGFRGGISQPCPAVVSYIERYLPELLPKLFPVQSPLMCSAIYAREELGITDKFAFISPCIAKKLEIEDEHNEGLVQYNVTFEHLMRYVKEHGIEGEAVSSEIEYGLGSFYPTPGGLAENVRWFLGDEVYIRQIEGERHLYEWIHINKDRIFNEQTPFLFVDALNCEKGCICGTAVNPDKSRTDDALYALLDIREASKKNISGDPWSRPDTPKERLDHFNKQFGSLNLSHYLRGYTDRSSECRYEIPDDEQLEEIYLSMNKVSEEARHIDCTCCGYESCRKMAIAIHNGFNRKDNCIYYEKTMVQELELEKVIAEEATRAKSAFLANMSHEIRTPINAVLGMNEMILRESGDPNITSYSESIRSAGNILLGLVNNILDFSKIENGKMEIIPVEYDLASVINDLVNVIQAKADEKGLVLSLDIDRGIPRSLFGDEIRMKQVITNLLSNAVKYTEKGSVTFRIGYERIDNEPDYMLFKVSVEDTGIGIKPEDLEKLFSEFERIEEKRNRNIEGTGLGLNIAKLLLDMMGSTLEISSVYGEGTTFSFSLKQRVIGWEELGDYQTAYEKLINDHKGYRRKFTAKDAHVLVVDDNPMNLIVFQNLLKQTKLNIDTAESGDEALSLASNKKYDIMFFDHMMPGKDGIETLRELKEQAENPNLSTTVVCLTANAISGAREQYITEGFDDYLTKPIDYNKLEDMFIRYLPKDKVCLETIEETSDSYDENSLNDELDGDPSDALKVLKSCEYIDPDTGINNSGDIDSYMSLIKIFYDTLSDKTEEILAFLENDDIKNYTIKVHALKSSLRIIGATDVGELAQKLENAGKMDDRNYINEHNDSFIDRCMRIKEILQGIFAINEDDSDKELAGDSLMSQIYTDIKTAAEEMDCDRLDELMADMESYAIPEDEVEHFSRIRKCIDHFDYEGILELL